MKSRHLLIPLVLGVGLILALAWALESHAASKNVALQAQSVLGVEASTAPAAVRKVCLAGPPTCDYTSVQDAVDAANSGDVIKVAAGTYAGVQFREWGTQTLYISKTVTVRGGYATTDWLTSDPLARPTTLDAQGQGRVVRIAGGISVTIDGLRITGGDTAQSGWWMYEGGGLYGERSHITLLNNTIVGNTASGGGINDGGGVYVYESNFTMMNNTVLSNTAGRNGGGVTVWYSCTATLMDNTFAYNAADDGGGVWLGGTTGITFIGNTIVSNTAVDYGGGLYFWDGSGTLSGNVIGNNSAGDYGGGMYLSSVDGTSLDGNVVISNVAGIAGGGVRLSSSDAMLNGNTISSNRAEEGGGLFLSSGSDAALVNNTIISNTAVEEGGGLDLDSSQATLISNTIIYNRVEQPPYDYVGGGGLYLSDSAATLIDNAISHNSAPWGGGIYLNYQSDALLRGNRIVANQATDEFGGGVVVRRSAPELVNNVIADNQAATEGSGVYVRSGEPVLLHNTIARNTGGDGDGLHVRPYSSGYLPSTVIMTNTILVSQTVGIDAQSSTAVTVTGILWFGNGTNVTGAGTVVATSQYTGTPAFIDPDAGDYHILVGSAAKDRGVSTGELFDLDGEYRPLAAPPDLGADEVVTITPECKARLNGGTVYPTIQAAIDASSAPTDLVEVAGMCEDAVTWNGGVYVAVLTKTLTLRGGYNPADFAWNPVSYPTILNGRSRGSVLAIMGGGIAPTVEHLTLLGGQAAEGGGVRVTDAGPTLRNLQVMENTAALGGALYLVGCDGGSVLMSNTIQSNIAALGGGVYLENSDIVLSKNTFADNQAQSRGGGLYLYRSAATLSENVVRGNDAPGGGSWDGGGGMYLWYSDAYLSSNTICGNTTERYGAGIHLQDGSDAVLSGNMIVSNTARGYGDGGGVYLWDSAPTLDDNVIAGNIAENGGGLYLNFSSSRAILKNNTIISNTADGWSGGGLYVHGPCTLINNVVADNYAERRGSGIYVYDASPVLLHTTIARNTGGDGSGIHVTYDSVVTLTNTIVVDHAVGVTVTDDSTATLNSVLWFDNGIDIGGLGNYHVIDPFVGDPAFAADGYHLAGGSAAISAGTDSGVTGDVDGEPRPMGDGYELGADEVLAVFARSTDSDVMVYTDTQGLTTTIHIPPNAVTETTLFVYLPVVSPTHPFPSGVTYAGRAFDLDAYCYQWHYVYLPSVLRSYSSSRSAVAGDAFIPASVPLSQRGAGCVSSPPGPIPCQPVFQTPVTITIHYSDADVMGLDENTLSLYYWTGSSWEDAVDTCTPASTYVRDTAGNVLQVAICHLSRWGMVGR